MDGGNATNNLSEYDENKVGSTSSKITGFSEPESAKNINTPCTRCR